MEWSGEVEAADWWVERMLPFGDHVVGSMVPAGFDRIARVFHPIETDDGGHRRWSDVAIENGRIPHAEMQLHRIASKPGENMDYRDAPYAEAGFLPTTERRRLAEILLRGGSDGPVWFGFSDIWGDVRCEANDGLPTAGEWNRQHFLVRGTLDTIEDVSEFAADGEVRSPGVWWPEDRSWFVMSEYDFTWTYVAGPNSLIEAIESSPDLEALESGYGHRGTANSDLLNRP